MFRHRRQLRRWAARLLVTWLFGIAAGLANACITAGPQRGGQSWPDGQMSANAMAVQTAAPGGSHDASNAATPPAGVGHGGAPANTNCQDFCDKSSISIPTALKSPLGAADAPCAPPPQAAADAFTAADWVRPGTRLPDPPRSAEPSITIAYLRLAL
jgi:hypothetical protein